MHLEIQACSGETQVYEGGTNVIFGTLPALEHSLLPITCSVFMPKGGKVEMTTTFLIARVGLCESHRMQNYPPDDPNALYMVDISNSAGTEKLALPVSYIKLLPLLDILGLDDPTNLKEFVFGVPDDQGSYSGNLGAYLKRLARILEYSPEARRSILSQAQQALSHGNTIDFASLDQPFLVCNIFFDMYNNPQAFYDFCYKVAEDSGFRLFLTPADPSSFLAPSKGLAIYLNHVTKTVGGEPIIRKLIFKPSLQPFEFVD